VSPSPSKERGSYFIKRASPSLIPLKRFLSFKGGEEFLERGVAPL